MKKKAKKKTHKKSFNFNQLIDRSYRVVYDVVEKLDDWIDLVDDKLDVLFNKEEKYHLMPYDKVVKVYVLDNDNRNEIEFRLFDRIKKLLKSKLSKGVKVELTNKLDLADVVIFSINEHLTKSSIKLLEDLDIHKIGIVTSGVLNVDLSKINYMTIISQSVNNQLSDKHLLSLVKARNSRLLRLPLSYMLDVKRDVDQLNIYQVDYHTTLFEFGLLTLMAYSLPSRYSHLKINCETEEQAALVSNSIKTDVIKISNVGKTASIWVNTPIAMWSHAVKSHGEIALLKTIRRIVDRD